MILLCPKALSSNDGDGHEREFLKYYLSAENKKAKLTNEVWETFRYKVVTNSTNNDGAMNLIAWYRGIFEPEITRIGADFQEVEASTEHNTTQMRDSVINFLKRNWADITVFITQEKQIYQEVCNQNGINMMTLSEFYLDCMDTDGGRDILMAYWRKVREDNF